MGHAIGFYHEHSRSDRDKYVKMILANVIPAKKHNFDLKTTLNFNVPYDYSSVMHYGQTVSWST